MRIGGVDRVAEKIARVILTRDGTGADVSTKAMRDVAQKIRPLVLEAVEIGIDQKIMALADVKRQLKSGEA